MKNVILAMMTAMTFAGSVSAETNAWDQFWGTDLPVTFAGIGTTFNPANTGWNDFWHNTSVTLDPTNTGWNDFWYQCQDEEKTIGDCVGTIAAGVGLALAIPVTVIGLGIVAVSVIPTAGTVVGAGFTASGTGFAWVAP